MKPGQFDDTVLKAHGVFLGGQFLKQRGTRDDQGLEGREALAWTGVGDGIGHADEMLHADTTDNPARIGGWTRSGTYAIFRAKEAR